jgi:hypothetical protein
VTESIDEHDHHARGRDLDRPVVAAFLLAVEWGADDT